MLSPVANPLASNSTTDSDNANSENNHNALKSTNNQNSNSGGNTHAMQSHPSSQSLTNSAPSSTVHLQLSQSQRSQFPQLPALSTMNTMNTMKHPSPPLMSRQLSSTPLQSQPINPHSHSQTTLQRAQSQPHPHSNRPRAQSLSQAHNPPHNQPSVQQHNQAAQPNQPVQPTQTKSSSPQLLPHQIPTGSIRCMRCHHYGSDVRIRNCPNGCGFHARCIDLIAVGRSCAAPLTTNPGASRHSRSSVSSMYSSGYSNDDNGSNGSNGSPVYYGNYGMDSPGSKVNIERCPHCSSAAAGLEILPLSFVDMDRAYGRHIEKSGGKRPHSATVSKDDGKNSGSGNGGGNGNGKSGNGNSSTNHTNDSSNTNSNSNSISSIHSALTPPSTFYDPQTPRTGRWTDEELAFRDSLISHFLSGSLPLPNGLKLIDFLSNMLKSKHSRLSKKMKHAKLSQKYYHIQSGYVETEEEAKHLSKLEFNFVESISDPIERTEIQFHMAREWREHFAERCNYVRIGFDGREWVKSVEVMEKRVNVAKNKVRMVRRRFMMGKAMETDGEGGVEGVFIDKRVDDGYGIGVGYGVGHGVGVGGHNSIGAGGGGPDGFGTGSGIGGAIGTPAGATAVAGCLSGVDDFEAISKALEHEGVSDDFASLYSSFAKDEGADDAPNSILAEGTARPADATNNLPNLPNSHNSHNSHPSSTTNHAHLLNTPSNWSNPNPEKDGIFSVSPLLTGSHPTRRPSTLGSLAHPLPPSSSEPNFKFAAPFLAGVISYIERNQIPFEHVDIWAPSFIPNFDNLDGTAPQPSLLGSGSGSSDTCRLCFAGSATASVQVVGDPHGMNGHHGNHGNHGSPPPVSAVFPNLSLQPHQQQPHQQPHHHQAQTHTVPLTEDEIFNLTLYGTYSQKFSFSNGCGLPGRVFKSGIPAWEQFVANAPPHLFERRGGAMQCGIKTALGLPIASGNVGRIVLVLYSRWNREKDEGLVERVVRDVGMFGPCPRWKLVVDVCLPRGTRGGVEGQQQQQQGQGLQQGKGLQQQQQQQGQVPLGATPMVGPSPLSLEADPHRLESNNTPTNASNHSSTANTPNNNNTNINNSDNINSHKANQIKSLISILGENMPSDTTSPLGQQLHSIMSLRLLLLHGQHGQHGQRPPEEEQLVDTILVLFESYLAAGRTRQDIALFLARDFAFHRQYSNKGSGETQQPQGQQGQSSQNQRQQQGQGGHQQHQQQPLQQLQHPPQGSPRSQQVQQAQQQQQQLQQQTFSLMSSQQKQQQQSNSNYKKSPTIAPFNF